MESLRRGVWKEHDGSGGPRYEDNFWPEIKGNKINGKGRKGKRRERKERNNEKFINDNLFFQVTIFWYSRENNAWPLKECSGARWPRCGS